MTIALCLPTPLRAQTKLVESIEVRVTNVDVVVTDKAGNPIVGLTKDDFEVYENNKRQTITNFYEVRPDSVAAPADMPAADDASAIPAEAKRRRIVFFVDNASLHPLRRNEVFASVQKFLDKLFRPGDQAMLVAWNRGLRVIVPFTDDASRIRKGLTNASVLSGGGAQMDNDKASLRREVQSMIDDARANTRTSRNGPSEMQLAYEQALSMARAHADHLYNNEKALTVAMSTMITTLAGLEGKKAMVFIGGQLPDKPGVDMFQWVDQTFASMLPITPNAFREAGRFSLSTELERVAKQANANNVTLYLIDGADPTKGIVGDITTNEAADPTVEFLDFTSTANTFGVMAQLTGGMALMRTNNFDLALNTVARDLGAYYSLGYRQDDDKPGDRKVVVKTKNPEFRVRSRKTYVAKSADDQTKDRVISNAFHSQVKGDIPVTLTTTRPILQDKKHYKVPVRITFPSNITLLPQDDLLVGGFTMYIAVVDDNAEMSAITKRSQTLKIKRADEAVLRSRPISFTAEVLVSPGEHYISVAIVDDIASSTGYARTRVAAR